MHDFFRKFAVYVSSFIGSGWALLLVTAVVLGTGYYFDFSEAWKIHGGSATALTSLFVLIFLQKSQNHSDKATHIKLDELIRATEGARDELAAAERRAAEHIDELDQSK